MTMMRVLSNFSACPVQTVKRYKKVIALLFCIFVVIYTHLEYNQTIRFDFTHKNVNGFCILPKLDLLDKEIMKFSYHPDPIFCEDFVSVVYVDDTGMLQFNTSALSLLKLSKENLSCTYSIVERNADDDVVLKPEVQYKKPEYINGDVVVVRCKDSLAEYSYENIHTNIDYRNVMKTRHIQNESNQQMSVLVFGIDSLSAMQALRKLPQTMKYFREVLGGIMIKGYTKVGVNTFPNLVPLLTGKRLSLKELPHLGGDQYFDDYPFIFYNYSRMGYATMFAEDWPKFSTFNYLAKGFNIQPTDHYIRPAYLAMRELRPLTTSLDQVFLYLEEKDIKLKTSSLCFRNTPKHILFLRYLKQYMKSYKNKLKFAFSWMNELSHDYVNFMELADQDILEFFKWMKEDGHLDNTILIFMSDHGSNIDEIRNTVSGRVETRMPLLAISLPEYFKRQQPDLVQTLWENTKVVTTPFDVNALFSDILYKRFDQNVFLKEGKLPRGIGLFRKIPKERTCADANIGESFCACYSAKTVNTTLEPIPHIAKAVVAKINLLLKNHKHKCAELRLSEIKFAQLVESAFQRNEDRERFTLKKYFSKASPEKEKYLVLLETMPGAALFEVTASYHDNDDVIIYGEILRTNRYGTQSQCITDKVLRNYCLCS